MGNDVRLNENSQVVLLLVGGDGISGGGVVDSGVGSDVMDNGGMAVSCVGGGSGHEDSDKLRGGGGSKVDGGGGSSGHGTSSKLGVSALNEDVP
ncbi:hypothetical protein E2C01_002311 [Portunus trituberculatus]|uniref:Uncharacterized protein n=1 Tax=Portunus trituberculatus TaxID=210409 RepID=A0A5B7CLX9_PORTR|nr:hypothetical protein [Portunus trituberculatus]